MQGRYGAGAVRWKACFTCHGPPGPDKAPRDGLATSCTSAEPKFVDTNVLVYLFDGDSPDKQARARELLGKEVENIVLSTQVLGEFYVTVTRKLSNPLGADMTRKAVDVLCAFQVRPLHAALVRTAASRCGESKLSYRDALIVETVIDAGAAVLLTEDLQHGQAFNGLRVVNPFREERRWAARSVEPDLERAPDA